MYEHHSETTAHILIEIDTVIVDIIEKYVEWFSSLKPKCFFTKTGNKTWFFVLIEFWSNLIHFTADNVTKHITRDSIKIYIYKIDICMDKTFNFVQHLTDLQKFT